MRAALICALAGCFAGCTTTTAPDGTKTTAPPGAAEIAAYEALAIQAANEGITIKQALDAAKANK